MKSSYSLAFDSKVRSVNRVFLWKVSSPAPIETSPYAPVIPINFPWMFWKRRDRFPVDGVIFRSFFR